MWASLLWLHDYSYASKNYFKIASVKTSQRYSQIHGARFFLTHGVVEKSRRIVVVAVSFLIEAVITVGR